MSNDRTQTVLNGWSFGLRHFLDPVPNLVQLGQIDIPKPFALRLQLFLESIESRDKFVGSGLQRAFGVEFAFASEIDHCEQQVADLILDRLIDLRSDRPLSFRQVLRPLSRSRR